jgi:uncharacterized protein YrzB (UPF0473 family)
MANNYEAPEEDMTISITLDDDTEVECDVVTILEVDGKDYIVVLPNDDGERFPEDEVWIYGYKENPDDPNEEPELIYIEDEDEYERVADAFDEYLDNVEFFSED